MSEEFTIEGEPRASLIVQEDLAGADPFALFYRPETDPTPPRFSIELAYSDPEALMEVMTDVPAWRVELTRSHNGPGDDRSYEAKLTRHATMYGMGAGSFVRQVHESKYRPWRECVEHYEDLMRSAGPGLGAALIREASLERLLRQEGPRLRVVRRDGGELGTIPRPAFGPADALHFRLLDEFHVYPSTLDDRGAVHLALPMDWITEDGGWTYEVVLDAGDVSLDLLGRIPGWRPSSR